ncbi:hypothetical protein C7B70_07630 [Chlorogloea sp. CCALA 695]|nr:hypothetical protein C7B70_07630 [Chlorogloea sp. CCALA 695]
MFAGKFDYLNTYFLCKVRISAIAFVNFCLVICDLGDRALVKFFNKLRIFPCKLLTKITVNKLLLKLTKN